VPVPESLLAVARAGAGVNNMPIAEYSKLGIVVFNTPGANANAVKELVMAGMLLATRGILPGIAYVQSLTHMTTRPRCRPCWKRKRRALPAARSRARRWASSAWARSARWWPTWRWRWA
jgi:lactate dehydrogenase-like 2-hydroxyacid dehydrogenase